MYKNIERMKKKVSEFWPIGIVLLILFFIYIYNWRINICPVVLNDEFGYWGNAATMAGMNWKELLGLTPYYSMGYSLILVPLFKLGLSYATMYRLAILMNMVFIFISYLSAAWIAGRLFPENEGWVNRLLGIITALNGGGLFYSQIAWCEVFLITLMWCLVALFISLEQNFKYSKAIGIVFLSFYIYLTHQRSIAVLALALCMVLYICFIKKKYLFIISLLGLSILLLLGYRHLKTLHVDAVYSNSTYSDNNNVQVTASFVGGFLSQFMSNTKDVLVSLICKFDVVLMTTAFSFLIACKELLLDVIRKRSNYTITKFFVILSVLSMLVLQSLQMFGNSRKDLVVYSRYMDYTLPMIALYGLGCVSRS